ncbi:Oidioi.mRNA.OKI2018_I69.chr2.g7622.t1.cds [Oikopleura dioica]|uniref:Oidioi.mRNA.OKI2018_I69.chr2.g7622.t1.cds n=1 Tax=Oikopleura dioica TaxID=34765 RepID=A0ABN7T7D4_OIKDI|nr:Oidioi.mRNA.OKI2018_I69.chr2.g7622.t1.cds [Oikopleura dioica]
MTRASLGDGQDLSKSVKEFQAKNAKRLSTISGVSKATSKKSSKKRKRGAKSVKSTMTSKTYKTAQLEHFDDPCIPDKICGLSLFDFTMTFLPWISFALFFFALIIPRWGVFDVETMDNNAIEERRVKQIEVGAFQECYVFDENVKQCVAIGSYKAKFENIVPNLVPDYELKCVKILIPINLFLLLIFIYWPFVGYATRSYGFMMSSMGYLLVAIMQTTVLVLWSSGYRKAQFRLDENYASSSIGRIKFDHLPMPNCIVAGVVILCVVGIMGLIFTCQNDYRKSHDMGNQVFRRMTRMTILSPKEKPQKEEKRNDKPTQKEYEKAKDVLNANPKLMERSDSGSSQGAFISTDKPTVHYEDSVADPKSVLEQKVDKILDTYSKDEIMRMVAEIQNGAAQSSVNTITETGNHNVAFTLPANDTIPVSGDNSYV